VAGAGDLDGDGFQDLVVGGPGDNSGTGVVTVWPGGPAPLDVGAVIELQALSPATDASFGASLAGPGDVDGDGRDDLLVGAPLASDGGLVTLFNDATAAPLDAAVWQSATAISGDDFGSAMAGAGDVDGDGLADFVVGTPGDAISGSNAGSVSVFLGQADLDTLTGTRLAPAAPTTDARFGATVSGGGDVDGDGYSDFAVGAPELRASGVAAYLWFGGSGGVDPASEQRLEPAEGADGTGFGTSVSVQGDLDGDGHADLVVGAPKASAAAEKDGAVFVFFGAPGGVDLATERQLSAFDPEFADEFGASVTLLGDHNGDGHPELLVGDPLKHGSLGAVYLFYGSASGPDPVDSVRHQAGDARNGARYGSALAAGPDLDGDGLSELVVGAYGDSAEGVYAGAVYVTWSVQDADLDGVSADSDCDDEDPGIDDTLVTVYADVDGDGHGDPDDAWEACAGVSGTVAVAGDCAPDDPNAHPGAAELESTTACRRDADGDGYGDADLPWDDELQPGSDCDDSDPDIWPRAPEHRGDEVDSDCDGTEYCYSDQDGDGWTDGRAVYSSDLLCDALGETTAGHQGDCDDLDPNAWPDAPEVCGDGLDSDCDGAGGPSDDEDGDGLSWSREDRLGTSDCETDSDGDGLSDGDEIAAGTDPARSDTDGDGLPDGSDDEPLVPAAAETGGCSSAPGPAGLGSMLLLCVGLTPRRRCSPLR